jgi:hypothetical protein
MTKSSLSIFYVPLIRRIIPFVCGALLCAAPARSALLIPESTVSVSSTGSALGAYGEHVNSLGYVFATNQAFSLLNPTLALRHVSLEFSFKLDGSVDLDQLVAVQSLSAAAALYQEDGIGMALPTGTVGGPCALPAAGEVAFTRDGATDIVSALTMGQRQVSILAQTMPVVSFSFATKDFHPGRNELSRSMLITAFDVTDPTLPIPEPSTVALLILGVSVIAFTAVRRKTRA